MSLGHLTKCLFFAEELLFAVISWFYPFPFCSKLYLFLIFWFVGQGTNFIQFVILIFALGFQLHFLILIKLFFFTLFISLTSFSVLHCHSLFLGLIDKFEHLLKFFCLLSILCSRSFFSIRTIGFSITFTS